jgi:phosphoserine phosphatase
MSKTNIKHNEKYIAPIIAEQSERIATLEAELAASREQSAQLAAALEQVLKADELKDVLRQERYIEAYNQARTALAAWQQANK